MRDFFKSIRIRRRSEAQVIQEGPDVLATQAEPERADTMDRAMTLATVYRCVKLISESVAKLPLREERQSNGIFRAVGGTLAALLEREPNEWTNSFDFIRLAVQSVLLTGQAVIIPQRSEINGRIIRFILANAGTVSHSSRLGNYQIIDPEQGISGRFSEDEIIRLKGATLDGEHCLSVLSFAARTFAIGATAERNNLTTYANGGSTMGLITNDASVPGYGEYATDALQALATRMSVAAGRGQRFIPVAGKAHYIPTSMSAADMQFLESRKFTVLEICRFFGVPPSFLGAESASNYKSAENATVAFLNDTLGPLLTQIEIEFTRKLIGMDLRRRFRFNRDELYSTDLSSKMQYVEKRIATGTLTPNEARALFGLEPVAAGDSSLVSANLKPLTELTSQK
ncbi:MAG: phage portal protein [Muribaculaceae bacterium]|nr:phage portal protein [Muribaculaceae bacterium]